MHTQSVSSRTIAGVRNRRSQQRTVLLATIVALLALPLLAAEPVFDLRSSTRFRLQHDDYGDDVDAVQHLSLYGSNLKDGHLAIRLRGIMDFDLDRDDYTDDAHDREWPRLYEAAFDFMDYGWLDHLVLGRQVQADVDYLHFDGLSISIFEDQEFSGFAFAGRPVSYYGGNDREWLVGGGVSWQPGSTTRLQADLYGINDLGEDIVAYALRGYQNFASGLSDRLELRFADDQVRDVSAYVRYYDQERQWDLSGSLYWQSERTDELADSRQFSLYSAFLGPAEEEVALRLNGHKYIGDHYIVSLGVALKEISDDTALTNIDTQHVFAGLTVNDLPRDGLSIDFYGNYFSHPRENYYDLTGEVGYQINQKLQASVGLSRSAYEFNDYLLFRDFLGLPVPDQYGGTQVGHTVFCETRYKLSKNWRLVLSAEYEESDGLNDDAYTVGLRVDYRHRFRPE